MKTKAVILAALAGALALGASPSVAQVSADVARKAAIKILLGDPYGKTPAAVARTIAGQTLTTDDYCHSGKRVWRFHIVVPKSQTSPDGIDGLLVLDAANAKLICAGLPFLD